MKRHSMCTVTSLCAQFPQEEKRSLSGLTTSGSIPHYLMETMLQVRALDQTLKGKGNPQLYMPTDSKVCGAATVMFAAVPVLAIAQKDIACATTLHSRWTRTSLAVGASVVCPSTSLFDLICMMSEPERGLANRNFTAAACTHLLQMFATDLLANSNFFKDEANSIFDLFDDSPEVMQVYQYDTYKVSGLLLGQGHGLSQAYPVPVRWY